MSLDFTGYHCSIKISHAAAIGSGFSAAGPACSPVAALKNALDDPKVSEWITATKEMHWSKQVIIEFDVGTAIPGHQQVSAPEMWNGATDEKQYNREVHAFVEEVMALQRKYNMGYAVNTWGRAVITRNIIPVKAISYNLEK
jgi:hypothetical protein